jgi:hypothetical protein
LLETKETERANTQLFRTLKNFEIGSLTKKLQRKTHLTLMMENVRLFEAINSIASLFLLCYLVKERFMASKKAIIFHHQSQMRFPL